MVLKYVNRSPSNYCDRWNFFSIIFQIGDWRLVVPRIFVENCRDNFCGFGGWIEFFVFFGFEIKQIIHLRVIDKR